MPGQRLALVELDALQAGAALAQDVLVDARRLAGDVLEDEDVGRHAPPSVRAEGAPTRQSLDRYEKFSHMRQFSYRSNPDGTVTPRQRGFNAETARTTGAAATPLRYAPHRH